MAYKNFEDENVANNTNANNNLYQYNPSNYSYNPTYVIHKKFS